MIKLICKKVSFYSENDENAFFEWIGKIKCVIDCEGFGDEVHLRLPKSIVSKKCLKELTALFSRYKIDLEQLQQLKNQP